MMEELKLCPFCNGKGELVVFKNPYVTSYISYTFCVSCIDCNGEGASVDAAQGCDCRPAIKEAIEAWNRRYLDSE